MDNRAKDNPLQEAIGKAFTCGACSDKDARIKALEGDMGDALEYLGDAQDVVYLLNAIDDKVINEITSKLDRSVGAMREALDAQEDK